MRVTLESTLVEYIGAQQRESSNWRTTGAALNFRASILHTVIWEISIYITIPALTLKLSRILFGKLNWKNKIRIESNREAKLNKHVRCVKFFEGRHDKIDINL